MMSIKVRRFINGYWFEATGTYNPNAHCWDVAWYKGWVQRELNDRLDRIERAFRKLETVISDYQWNKPRQQ